MVTDLNQVKGRFMKYRKFNKYEKKEVQKQALAAAMHGEGLYLYENNTKADLTLPRPTKSGTRLLSPKARFQGDNYYMQMVRQGFLKLIEVLQTPEQQNQILKEESDMEEKLILDQPDIITEKGKVEHVVTSPNQQINESGSNKQQEVLLNESPDNDSFVIV